MVAIAITSILCITLLLGMLIAYKYSQVSKNNKQVKKIKNQYNLKKNGMRGISNVDLPTKWDNLHLREYTDGTFDVVYYNNNPRISRLDDYGCD